jgi:hypothetical protein
MTARKRLTVVPPAPPARQLEDMDNAEAADWLRKISAVSRDLCNAVDRYLGPERPAPRPRLTVLRGGRAGDDQ